MRNFDQVGKLIKDVTQPVRPNRSCMAIDIIQYILKDKWKFSENV
jgi:hypothetical protein